MKKMIFAVLFCLFCLTVEQVAATDTSGDVPASAPELAELNKVLQDVSYDLSYSNSYEIIRDKEQLVVVHAGEQATMVKEKYMGGYIITGRYSLNPQDLDLKWLVSEEDEEFPGTYMVRLQCKSLLGGCIQYHRREVMQDKDKRTLDDKNINIKRHYVPLIINNAETAKSVETNLKKLLDRMLADKKK